MANIADQIKAIEKQLSELKMSMCAGGSSVKLTPLENMRRKLTLKETELAGMTKPTKKKEALIEAINKLREKIEVAENKPAPEKKPRKKAAKEEASDEKTSEEETPEDDASDDDEVEVEPAKVEPPKAEPPKAEPKKKVAKPAKAETVPETKAEPVKAAEPEKKVTRLVGKTLKKLEETLGTAWNDSHKKSFLEFVNNLSSDAFAAVGLEEHMKTYAASLKPVALSIEDLRSQSKDLDEMSVGVYRNKTTNVTVTGPEEAEDEELEDATVDGKEYFIGQTSQRVYETVSGKDVFVGYWGVGKFTNASM